MRGGIVVAVFVALAGCGSDECEGTDCHPPGVSCNGTLTNLDFDPNHCGACGNACAADEKCAAGKCVCAGGLTECDGRCVDLDTDPEHCGACECHCGSLTCSAGQCAAASCPATVQCRAKDTIPGCGQPFLSCVDTNSDIDNCGACGNACDTAGGFVCTSGACDCSGATTNCSGVCVDTSNDPDHCGMCDNPCAAGESCVNGQCG